MNGGAQKQYEKWNEIEQWSETANKTKKVWKNIEQKTMSKLTVIYCKFSMNEMKRWSVLICKSVWFSYVVCVSLGKCGVWFFSFNKNVVYVQYIRSEFLFAVLSPCTHTYTHCWVYTGFTLNTTDLPFKVFIKNASHESVGYSHRTQISNIKCQTMLAASCLHSWFNLSVGFC